MGEFADLCKYLQLIADEHAEQDKRLIAMDKRLQDLKKERGLLQRELLFIRTYALDCKHQTTQHTSQSVHLSVLLQS